MILLFYVDVITYPCPGINTRLADPYQYPGTLLLKFSNFNPTMDE